MPSVACIQLISDEVMTLILSYLRAVDMGYCSQVGSEVFSKKRITDAASLLLNSVFDKTSPATTRRNIALPRVEVTPVVLFVNEMSSLLSVISSPLSNKGYWVSTSWLAATRKYCETIASLELDNRRKISKTRQKKQSYLKRNNIALIPPTSDINADITCVHGGLLIAKEGKTRRKIVDASAWQFLRQLYPHGTQFKSHQSECSICLQEQREIQLLYSTPEKRAYDKSSATTTPLIIHNDLTSLLHRRSGVPNKKVIQTSTEIEYDESDLLAWSIADAVAEEEGEVNEPFLLNDAQIQPLQPGFYNIVPRSWLKLWRKFIKDPPVSSSLSGVSSSGSSSPYAMKSTALPPLDCTGLLCHSHGLLVIPPHLEEYLVGLRRNLLSGLGKYRGEIVEVITQEEWELLQASLNSLSDFSVRFCLDGSNITWNIPICVKCDRLHYAPS